MKKIIAYHGKESVKSHLIAQLQAHYDADEIVKGMYWENGKGCAVGCTVHSGKHADYETQWGIPRLLAKIEDGIFEGLPNELSKKFPLQFARSINPGADLSKIWPKFVVWLLIDEKFGVLQHAKTDDKKYTIKKVAELYSKNRIISLKEWDDVRKAADAADAAAYDAYAAAYAADAADAASGQKMRIAQRDKLLELLSECKCEENKND